MKRSAGSPAKTANKRRAPRPASSWSETYFFNAALYYLQRFAASEAQLKRVLQRKIVRASMAGEEIPHEVNAWIDHAVAKCVRLEYVDDTTYADNLVKTLRRAGKSRAIIARTLQVKGVPQALAKEALGAGDEDTELLAAQRHVQRKRLGRITDAEARQKDLAKLLRAGFSLSTAKAALVAPTED